MLGVGDNRDASLRRHVMWWAGLVQMSGLLGIVKFCNSKFHGHI